MLNKKSIKIRRTQQRYISKSGKIEDNMSKYEIREYRRKYSDLRKISNLMKLPFEKWTKNELVNLIEEYDLYYMIQLGFHKRTTRISKFVYSGEFERFSTCEEFKKG